MQIGNFNPKPSDYFEKYEERQKMLIKRFFKDKIKISFLFKIVNILREKYGIYEKLLKNFELPSNEIYGFDCILLGMCNHITGIHSFNTFLLNEQERVKLHNDQQYIEKLCNNVVEQATLYNCDHENFSKLLIKADVDFLYYPPVYSLYILLKKVKDTFESNYKKEKKQSEEQYQVLKSLLIDILNHSTVIFVLIQHGYYENIYPLLRKTIETYVIYLTLKHSNMNVDHYMKFQHYKIAYECSYELDNDFVKLYENSQKTCSIQEYLNYGWIDEIIESYYLSAKNKYTIKSLVELVNSLVKKNIGEKGFCKDIYLSYQKCHYFSHAKIYNFRYEIIMIMDICKGLYEVFNGLVRETNFKDDKSNGVDIVKYSKDSVLKLQKLRNAINNVDLDKYYRERGIKK